VIVAVGSRGSDLIRSTVLADRSFDLCSALRRSISVGCDFVPGARSQPIYHIDSLQWTDAPSLIP